MVRSIIYMTVGLVFVVTGMLHYQNSYYFLRSITAYQILGWRGAFVLAAFAPYLHLMVGTALVANIGRGGASLVALLLLSTYGLANLSALWHGLPISCGCFGSVNLPVSWLHVAVQAALGVGLIFAVRSEQNVKGIVDADN